MINEMNQENFWRREPNQHLSTSSNKGINRATNNTDEPITPKSQKQNPTDVKRWASVVKAKKRLQSAVQTEHEYNVDIDSALYNPLFKSIPKNLENHLNFITSNKDVLFCNVCSLHFYSIMNLTNHLKTRKHEDNVITFLKAKLPIHLHQTMEFVSFYDSNLCCNLCRCKINLVSHNPHESIVNIFAHNTDKAHISQKANYDTCNLAHNLLNSLAATNPNINENSHFIDKKMKPQFRCKLCSKNILFDENVEVLEQNFISHFKSANHVKNERAVELLRLFREASTNEEDNFIVLNGNITCTFCNHQVEPDLQKLISHENGVEHAKNVLTMLSSSFNQFPGNNKGSWEKENKANEEKTYMYGIKKQDDMDNKEKLNDKKIQHKSRLNDLLKSLPTELKNIDYLIENEKGSITCLTCNRVVPPNIYNLRTHLLGSNHKKNEDLKKNTKLNEIDTKDLEDISIKNQDVEGRKSNKQKENAINLIKNQGKGTGTICQCFVIPNFNNIKNARLTYNHSQCDHREDETLQLNEQLRCPEKNIEYAKKFAKVPKSIRIYKCRSIGKIAPSIIKDWYDVLLKENPLISENENVIVKNVDGKHSYCRVCMALIPLSLDLNCLEKNIVSHLEHNAHKRKFNEQSRKTDKNSKENIQRNEGVVRSLFNLPSSEEKKEEDTTLNRKVQSDELDSLRGMDKMENTTFVQRDNENPKEPVYIAANKLTTDQKKILHQHLLPQVQMICPKIADKVISVLLQHDEKQILNMLEHKAALKAQVEEIVNQFESQKVKEKNQSEDSQAEVGCALKDDIRVNTYISGNGGNPGKEKCNNAIHSWKRPSFTGLSTKLPNTIPTRLIRLETETDENVLIRRQKQIDYGKNTEGYNRYFEMVSQSKRGPHHPVTPPKHLKCSRRTWDGMIRVWRRQLHDWDPPSPSESQTQLDLDIQPLAPQVG